MLFLVRCVFWLGIVFSVLPWNLQGWKSDASPDRPARLFEAARSTPVQENSRREYSRMPGDYCATAPLQCLSAARQLHELFERVRAEGDGPAAPPLTATPPSTLKAQDKSPRWRTAGVK